LEFWIVSNKLPPNYKNKYWNCVLVYFLVKKKGGGEVQNLEVVSTLNDNSLI